MNTSRIEFNDDQAEQCSLKSVPFLNPKFEIPKRQKLLEETINDKA